MGCWSRGQLFWGDSYFLRYADIFSKKKGYRKISVQSPFKIIGDKKSYALTTTLYEYMKKIDFDLKIVCPTGNFEKNKNSIIIENI